MGKHYFQPEPGHEVHKLWADVIEQYHPMIHKLSTPLRVGILFVTVDDTTRQNALTLHGRTCAAFIAVVDVKLRATGSPDVLLQVDGNKWLDLDESEKIALLDHEAEHIAFPKAKQSPDGGWHPELDSLDRPKVGMKLHDWEFGGFTSIVERHGESAIEKRSLDNVNEMLKQKSLSFMGNDETTLSVSLNGGEEVTFKQGDFAKIAKVAEELRRKSG